MNEISIIINGIKYDAVEMTRGENDMDISCNLCDLQHECKNAPIHLEIPCGHILGLSRYFKKSDKQSEPKNEQEVCVVHIKTRRFFDEFQNSYLPVMHSVFGVYSTREKAEYAVWDYFANKFEGEYTVCFDDFDSEGNRLSYDLCFKREDKIYKGHALYCIDFSLETIDV